ncbi:MAG TPA: PQQ-binding-like beta-propeller repeat protein, partial [Rhizomicrobium sp.]|nr:PQQ-binding-like beta-propeller repeat protein [Rhizomicrobium sp.]
MIRISTKLRLAFLAAPIAFLAGPATAQLAPLAQGYAEPPPVLKLIEPGPAVPDWLGYNYDQQRTGWNRGETTLSKKTVGKLKPLWNTQLTTASQALVLSTLTAPVVAAGVATPAGAKDLVFSISIEDTLAAVDANSGQIAWQKHFANPGKPLRATTLNCSNTEQATPVIDKARGVIYFTTSDGKLRGARLADGAE